jgi:ribonuclease-3
MAELDALQEILGISFNDPSLLETAVVHSSSTNESRRATGHNERLEFLGDAVLGFIVARRLYQDSPDLDEGEMTRLRSALVSRETLSRAARSIRLGDFLYLGKGEEASGGRDKAANLAGALEAVIAAVLLDQGEAATTGLVLRLLDEEMAKVLSRRGAATDYKSRLQELAQSRYQLAPTYRLVDEAGPAHDKTFTVEVLAGGVVLGRGKGRSKKSAETEAARFALEHLKSGFTD